MSDRRAALGLLLRLPFRDQPWRPIIGVALQVASQLAFVAVALALKVIVDDLVQGDRAAALRAAGLLGAGTVLTIAAGFASYVIRMGMVERTTMVADAELAALISSIPTIDHHGHPEHLDRLELLRNEHRQLAALPDVLALAASTLLRLIATVAVLVRVDAALLLLVPCAVPSVFANWRAQKRYADAHDQIAPAWRRQGMIFRLVGLEPNAREVRVLGAQDGLLRQFDAAIEDGNSALFRSARRTTIEQTAGWAFFGAAFAAALVAVARRAIDGGATPGDLVVTITLGSQLTTQLAGFTTMIAAFAAAVRTAERYGWLVKRATAELDRASTARTPPPSRLDDGVRFENVDFAYPGTDTAVVSDLSFHLPAGATVALVGDNGAGKTTIVKLLTRMYEPTSGQILIDGVPLTTIEPSAWRTRISAAFQDHAHLELTAQHAVGVGSLPHLDDTAAVQQAMTAAHADEMLTTLPQGLVTQLGRQFDDNGTELSGGQWQKVAVARAMLREEPLLLALDEPTAALDPQTEAALFERYADAARRARNTNGAITLIVSHRFSTVRMADLILVVANNTVTEAGTHDQLIRQDGLYAELYHLQSRSYQ